MKILLNLAPKGAPWTRPSKILALCIKEALEALILANQLYLRLHHAPALYESGIRYEEEPAGQPYEDFSSIPVVISRGWGDCDDVVAWRIAELRQAGESAKVRLKWEPDLTRAVRMYHVMVRRADGSIEDPSLLLGMGNHAYARQVSGRLTP
jgi:hypothetical protein